MPVDDLPTLDVNDEMLADIAALIDSADRLGEYISASAAVGQRVGVGAVVRAVGSKLNISTTNVRAALVALLNLHLSLKGWKRTPESAVEMILRSLRAVPGDEHEKLAEQWASASASIVAALTSLNPDHPLVVAAKAYRVAMSRQYELVGVKIFTDLRPVFNEAGDGILQAVVTHILSIDYHEGADHRVLQFTLDANDLKDLKEACARAERKGAVVKRELQKLSWPTTVFREPTETQE